MDLEQFRQVVQKRIEAANVEPKWSAEAATKYMAQFAPRRNRFSEIARHLVTTVIEPRMAAVAGKFGNVTADRNAHVDRSVRWFGYCDRFPVTARLEFGVGHDERIEQLVLRYELDLMPTFVKYDAYDKQVMPLDSVDDGIVADWVERKLLEFLDIYLAVDRGLDDFDDEPVTDPVCGMRIRRSPAAASSDYKGHAYFFCSPTCSSQFDAAPEQYVTVRV